MLWQNGFVVTCFYKIFLSYKKLFYNVVQTSSEISESEILLKVCVWYRCQNGTEKLSPWSRTIKFLSKSTTYQNTGWEKKNVL